MEDHPQPTSLAPPEQLEPSKLGTKAYWDTLYATEITNHVSNPDDIGTVWFDDSDAEAKLVAFLNDHACSPSAPSSTSPLQLDAASTSFLDLGTGNGSLLHALRRAGWAGRCLGVDYSLHAVTLARQIAESVSNTREDEQEEDDDDDHDDDDDVENHCMQQQREAEETQVMEAAGPVPGGSGCRPRRRRREKCRNPVEFAQWDVLGGPLTADVGAGEWDVVLDKGTFDAVCLNAEVDAAGRRPSERYRSRVLRLLRPGDGGVFLVTSCNWTDTELRAWFEGRAGGDEVDDVVNAEHQESANGTALDNGTSLNRARFEFAGQVKYRSFSFGGVKGQTISTVCFVKKEPL